LLHLPLVDCKLVGVKTLSGGKANLDEGDRSLMVSLEEKDRDPIASVIELMFDGPVLSLPAMDVNPRGFCGVAVGCAATASNVFNKQDQEYGPQKAFDGDAETRWATDEGVKKAWLEVDLGAPQSIRRIVIDEGIWARVLQFEVQTKEGDAWQTVATGSTIGADKEIILAAPTEGRIFRLNILDATDGPTIQDFQLFNN
jgi:hypothetical protein